MPIVPDVSRQCLLYTKLRLMSAAWLLLRMMNYYDINQYNKKLVEFAKALK
jgi:hypothetical protein